MILPLLIGSVVFCEGDIVDAIEQAQGGPIEVVAPELQSVACSMKRPAEITKPTTITGPGEWFLSINAPAGAFHARAPLKLRGLSLWRADWPTDAPAFGVHAEARVVVEEVDLSGFTVGVYVLASVSDYGTNANGSIMRDVKITGSGHAGIILRGRDSNVFAVDAVRVYTSCEHASKWTDALGPCAGVVDRSFFGGVFSGMLIASTGEVIAGRRTPGPPMIVSSSSGHTVVVGLYRERDQSNPQMAPATVAIGGLSSPWDGTGLRVDGPTLSGLSVTNAQDPTRTVTTRMGSQAAPGSWVDYVAPWDTSRPLRRQADVGAKCWREVIANQLVTSRVCSDGSVR